MTWYLMVAVVFGVGGYLLRRRLVRGPADLDATHLTGAEVGYLTGGPKRAVTAVLAGLRVAGSVQFTDGRVVQAEAAPQTWGRLGPVVRIAAADQSGLPGLLRHRSVADALNPVGQSLTADGWLLADADTRRVRQISVPTWILAGVGVFLTVRAMTQDRPFGWLVVSTLAVLYAAFPLSTVPELTANARRALGRLTGENAHLSPAANPSLLTYGPAAAAVAVGLYGTVVLLPLDADLALAADRIGFVPEEQAHREAAGSAGSGGGGEACGSASTGSSCGSSCGGGCGGGCGGE